jgi:hypothetical protein
MGKRKALKARLKDLCKHEWEYQQALKLLPAVKKAIGGKGGKIYAEVETVAQSGMSVTVALRIVHKGSIINLNDTVFAKIYGDSIKNGTVRVHGCGMDMLFDSTYRLYQFLFDQHRRPYQKHLNRYIG